MAISGNSAETSAVRRSKRAGGFGRLQRAWRYILLLAVLGSPCVAARSHSTRRPSAAVADAAASSLFDRVPITALRIAGTYGVVTSTYRTVAHNRAVGGVPDSYHLLGRAIDVARRAGVTHAQIAASLRAAGFVLIESLDENDHSHFAFGPVVSAKSTAAAVEAAPVDAGPRVAADEHGSLIADIPAQHVRDASSRRLRVHLRRRR